MPSILEDIEVTEIESLVDLDFIGSSAEAEEEAEASLLEDDDECIDCVDDECDDEDCDCD